MMNKWMKIEEFLNTLLTRIANSFKNMTPKRLTQSYANFKASCHKLFVKVSKIPEILTGPFKRWLKTKISMALVFILAQKQNLASLSKSISEFKLSSQVPLNAFNASKAFFTKNVVAKLAAVSPAKAVGITCTVTAFSLTGISVYQNIQEINEKNNPKKTREVASVDEEFRKQWSRSSFRNAHDRTIFLRGVDIPIYIKNRDGMKSLLIDVRLETSNRYTAKFFYIPKNEVLIRDRLNSSLQAVVPDFPLQPEGKKIIKEKVRLEVNKLIEELKIEGNVDKVYIHSILNG